VPRAAFAENWVRRLTSGLRKFHGAYLVSSHKRLLAGAGRTLSAQSSLVVLAAGEAPVPRCISTTAKSVLYVDSEAEKCEHYVQLLGYLFIPC
jgi:hypothetical protein